MQPTYIDHILVLLLGLALPFFSGIRGSEKLGSIHFDARTRRRFYLSNSMVLWIMAGVVMGIWFWNNRTFSLMGFRMPEPEWTAGILSAVLIILYVGDILYSMLSPAELQKTHEQWESSVPFLPERYRELPAYTFMCIAAGVCEEIMYRGFLVNYFIDPMKPGFPWMAAVFPAILFSIAHFYQGYKAIAKIFLLSLLFALIFIFSKSLLFVVIIHFLIDFTGGILAIKLKSRN
ncbi:MAG TPA: CPBP family intramembrane glutamic endopeptidase [Chitinophagaceae bacterium]|nr:CPBP family intramembrane glutamic endopeptidase [Chitinophagaceae bacterium]